MGLEKCLPEMVEKGEITPDQAERMRSLYDELEADLSSKFGKQAASAMASEEALKRFGAEAAQAKRQTLLQISAQRDILASSAKFKGERRGDAFVARLAPDDRDPDAALSAWAKEQTVHTQALGMMNGVLEKFGRNVLGRVRNRAVLANVVREAFGEHTGDEAAKELAEAWGRTAEMLRTRFNAAGGAIGKLEKWGMPQVHNSDAVGGVSYEEWRNFIRPLLDTTKMLDTSTGLSMTTQGMETALRSAYDQISSDGWAYRKPGSTAGIVGKTANRRQDSRFLVFKDADSWLHYGQRFGRPQSGMANAIDPDGPIFDAMMGHISGMSRDIALMETLGPNPSATIRWMQDVLAKEAHSEPTTRFERATSITKPTHQLADVYAELSGTGRAPVATKLGTWFGAFKQWQTASKLGSAAISAVTDIGFQATTRKFNGLPVTGALNGYLRQFNPASAADRAVAARIGFGAIETARSAIAQSRYVGEVVSGEMAARLAQGVLHASGLSAWTEAGKAAFGRDFLSHITAVSGQKWDTLHPPFRKTLERYGFGPSSWESLRQTPLEEYQGGHWIFPENIQDRAVADRMLGMILNETIYAVPEADIRTRALLNQHLPARGTLMGEIVRAPLQFKSFGVSMLMLHGRRTMQQQGYNKLAYAAGLAITTTLMGALNIQMHALLRGEDPQPMADEKHGTDPTFWAQSMVQGGGLGMAGDFFNSATSRTGGGPDEYILGPAYGDLKSYAKLGYHLGQDAMGSPTADPGRDLTRIVQSDTPGSSLWYAKLAFNRAILDQMQMQIDPNYAQSFSRMENKARQSGQDYWWPSGETRPTRAPDMANALAAAPQQ